MDTLEQRVRASLFSMQDEAYRNFHKKLVPTVDEARIIGVRAPLLRRYAKTLTAQGEGTAYLDLLPHRYIEENTLHAFLVNCLTDYDDAIARTEAFLPHVDNWATCDSFQPRVFKAHSREVFEEIHRWLQSSHTYTVRFALVTLLNNYLDADFRPEGLAMAAALETEEYYIRMAVAWYFSVALVKQYDAALPWLLEPRLDKWTHNKAIQKAIESYRISPEIKTALRRLKR